MVEPDPTQINNAATRTALAMARLLTHWEDQRIPTHLPTKPDELQSVIAQLEEVAADYAERSFQHQPEAPERARAYAMMVHTRAAGDIIRAMATWAKTANADPGPLHITAEAALLGILTWEMTAGHPKAPLIGAARSCVMSIANDVALNERSTWIIPSKIKRQMDAAANADTDAAHTRIDFTVDPDLWRVRAHLANRTATFYPVGNGDSAGDALPCVELGGIQIYCYFHPETGKLKVSPHFDTAEPWLLDHDGNVPVEINVDGTTVFEA